MMISAGPLAYAVDAARPARISPAEAAGAAVDIPMTVSWATPIALGSSLASGTDPALARPAGDSTVIRVSYSAADAYVVYGQRKSRSAPQKAQVDTCEIVASDSGRWRQEAEIRQPTAVAESDDISPPPCSTGSGGRSASADFRTVGLARSAPPCREASQAHLLPAPPHSRGEPGSRGGSGYRCGQDRGPAPNPHNTVRRTALRPASGLPPDRWRTGWRRSRSYPGGRVPVPSRGRIAPACSAR